MKLDLSKLVTDTEIHLLLVDLGAVHAYRMLAAAAARAGLAEAEIDRIEQEALRQVDHARMQYGLATASADKLTDDALEALRTTFAKAKSERVRH
jgi:hypothetical protein